MMSERSEFIEGFLAAARILCGQPADEHAPVSIERQVRRPVCREQIQMQGVIMSVDDYLEVPTYLRRDILLSACRPERC